MLAAYLMLAACSDDPTLVDRACGNESPNGQLGYGNTDTVGTGMTPATAGDIPYL